MSKIYIRLLAFSAFILAATGASFSVFGLAKLFAGASMSVAVMAATLEFTKLVVTGFLYRYWGHISSVLRTYMTFAVIALMVITSVGIYGYLSSAYQVASIGLHAEELHVKSLSEESARLDARIAEIREFIEKIPPHRISRKYEFRKRYEPEIADAHRRQEEIQREIADSKTKMLKTHADVGPAMYLAQTLGVEIDTVVRWLIFLFVSVFDPLAICLVFCLNLAIRLREKYRGNEVKIAEHSFTTPVDHRYKKSA